MKNKKISLTPLRSLSRRFHVGWVVSAGFGILVSLLMATIIAGLYTFSHHNHHLAEVSESATRKIYLAFSMRNAIRERIDSLRIMVNMDDPFDRDEQRLVFYSHARIYSQARSEMIRLATHPQEKAFIEKLDRAAREARPSNRLALSQLSLLEEEITPATQDAVSAAIIAHLNLLNRVSEMVALQDEISKQALQEADLSFRQSMAIAVIVGVISVIIAILTASMVIARATEKNRQLSYQASHDALTGLPNRAAFEQAVSMTLEEASIDRTEHVLLFMDLDQFKLVNDTKGHQAGDKLLQALSKVLSAELRSSDLLARLGGDEFGVLLRFTNAKFGEMVADKLRRAVEEFVFDYDNESFRVGVSIGMTPFSNDDFTLERLLSIADASCYAAKDSGRNRIHRSDLNADELSVRDGEMRWASRISQAINEDRFVLHGQAMRPLSGRAMNTRTPVELLLRLMSDDGEDLIFPGDFLPAAERYGKMFDIDCWVLKHAIAWLETLGELQNQIVASINICGRSASDPQFADFVHEQLQASSVDPRALCFEITESVAVHSLGNASRLIEKVGAMGCHFALDDFGSGVSSFSYLRHLKVDWLKIDGSYISNIEHNVTDRSLVESINNISHTLGKLTVAEFVESESTMKALKNMGVDYAQGFGFHRPVPLREVEKFLRQLDPGQSLQARA